jgi:hypothetical protein
MKTSSLKSKGRSFQQDIRDLILATFPILEPDDVKSTGMGQSGEDIQLSPHARKIFPYSIEAKRQEKLSIPAWWRQTITNIKENTNPVLIFRQSRQKALVVITLEHFMELVKENSEMKIIINNSRPD